MATLGYDIFRTLEDGSPRWVDAAGTLEQAREKLASMARSAPGAYFVRAADTGEIVIKLGEMNDAAM
jgi:hypothetical protein